MEDKPESNKEETNHPEPDKKSFPKRGAIPTPKEEIEKAKKYIPETDPDCDKPATKPVSPEDVDRDSQQEQNKPK